MSVVMTGTEPESTWHLRGRTPVPLGPGPGDRPGGGRGTPPCVSPPSPRFQLLQRPLLDRRPVGGVPGRVLLLPGMPGTGRGCWPPLGASLSARHAPGRQLRPSPCPPWTLVSCLHSAGQAALRLPLSISGTCWENRVTPGRESGLGRWAQGAERPVQRPWTH